jgi:hypothetical protein
MMFGFNFFGNDNVEIQVQEGVSQWRTIETTANDPSVVAIVMQQNAVNYPNYRVRAVENGRIVDML